MGEYARLNGNLKSWQEDYYQKTQHNHKQVFMEIDRLNEEIADINIRIKKNTDTGASNLAKIVSLENANAKVEELTKDIQKVIDKYDLEIQKIGLMQDQISRQAEAHTKLRTVSENYENHYALIENFVEKYVPIQIQQTITENLQQVMTDQMRKQYAPFEKKRTGELHEVILQDDGIPKLADTLK